MDLALAQRPIYSPGVETSSIRGRAGKNEANIDYKAPEIIGAHHLEPQRVYAPSLIKIAGKEEIIELEKLPRHKRAVLDLVDAYIDKHGLAKTDCINYRYDETANTLTLRLGQALDKDEITLWRYQPKDTKAKVYFHDAEHKGHLSSSEIRMKNQMIQDFFNEAQGSVTKVLTKEENRKIFSKKFKETEADHHVTYCPPKSKALETIVGGKDTLFSYEDHRYSVTWLGFYLSERANPKTRPGKITKFRNPHEVLHTLVEASVLKGENRQKFERYPSLGNRPFYDLIDGVIRLPCHKNDSNARQYAKSVLKGENPERDIENLLMLVFCGEVPDLNWKPSDEQVSFAQRDIRDQFRNKPLKSSACREKFFKNKGKETLKSTSDKIRTSVGILLANKEAGQPDCRNVSRGLDLLIEIKRRLGEEIPSKEELREELMSLGKIPYYETANFKEHE